MLILENLRIVSCEITVDVGDTSNSGQDATLTFDYSVNNNPVHKEKIVSLHYPASSQQIPSTEHTGQIHKVTATLTSKGGVESTSTEQLLPFC